MIKKVRSDKKHIASLPLLWFAIFSATLIVRVTVCEAKSDTQWIMDYLKSRRLPALKEIKEWQNEYAPGVILRTEHYKIHTTLLDPLMLSQLPSFIESAYNSYQKQLPEPVETAFEFPVYLFADRQQWEDFTKTFAGEQADIYLRIKAGAYYLKDTWIGYNIGRKHTFSVLGHEGWHQFNRRHFKFRLPSWLDEGIATTFEASRYENGVFKFDPSLNLNRLAGLKMTLTKGKMIPLRKLISINPGQVLTETSSSKDETSSDEVIAFYSQSYALIRFLKEDDYGKRLASFQQMLLDGLNGNWPIDDIAKRIATDRNIPLTVTWNSVVGTKIFEHYIGSDIEQIEQQYVDFCRKLVYNIHFKDR